MAGGNPYEAYTVFGKQIPRYKMAGYGMLAYVVLITGFVQYRKMQPPAPIQYQSKEEENYVKRYVAYMEEELKKPELLRQPFTGRASI
ncbi:uncharacterized protein EV422DRAFT_513718 [Fimicolochytrium jonesii]|uniref:uncharacterized protein n=1 Tax=Fimicolochytrium jonesii TaxID=1396493 RepID=UPI0022FDB292|nr:uncharacterized protein EV422DRAFT_513718 [Fimicolochytrium jonesii]KAI8825655.1 hypothetical protein EV422DRAFT_513718 [Fimicolochytrium jonesii]